MQSAGEFCQSTDSTDFFGIKPSQVDCPHGSRMGGRAGGRRTKESNVTTAIC